MFLRRLIDHARFAAAEAMEVTRRCVATEPGGRRYIDAAKLESRVLLSASPMAAALIESVEPTTDSVDVNQSVETLGDNQESLAAHTDDSARKQNDAQHWDDSTDSEHVRCSSQP